ncbi:PREDICTED: serum deprivation-response protein [Nanorana parkeri]|uniref:serum deprivation-response protein n=1 Tax=Nanorana parkeri TaxID=125878 RepID=UPI000854EBEC|nr:PREDICTED: serum deprivation-response protein [Nanorana parkeri]
MEEDSIQLEHAISEEKAGVHESQELVVPSHSPAESPSSSPTPQQHVVDSIKDSNQVNAITVLTLLDKLVNMLDSVQENQHKMEKKQIDIENSVKGIQSDITKLSKSHTTTSNTVSKLLEKSRKVSANMREVKDRMDKQTAQVKKLENNQSQLLRRNNFKVLIFQEENEIPASVFVKEQTPVPSITEGIEELADPNKLQEETMHTIDLSSDDEINHDEDGHDDSLDEKLGPSRAEKMKRSSLKKVDSLKKAFSRQNIEKKMNKISTKIVSPERREKIKKSFTPSQNKTSKGSSFKVPIGFNVKKSHDEETHTENEGKKEDVEEQAVNEQDVSQEDEKTSPTEDVNAFEEVKVKKDATDKEDITEEVQVVRRNTELAIVEDEDENEIDFECENPFNPEYKPKPGELEDSYEAPTQSTALQIDQSA